MTFSQIQHISTAVIEEIVDFSKFNLSIYSCIERYNSLHGGLYAHTNTNVPYADNMSVQQGDLSLCLIRLTGMI